MSLLGLVGSVKAQDIHLEPPPPIAVRPHSVNVNLCLHGSPSEMDVACNSLIGLGGLSSRGLAVAHYQIGFAAIVEAQYQRAANELTAAIQLDPSNSKFYVARATANNALCHLDAAVDDDSRAIAMTPSDPAAYYGRGLIRLRMGKDETAKADFAEAERLSPSKFSNPNQAAIKKLPKCSP